MEKIVQKINWDMPFIKNQYMFVYPEADLESNQKMQEPLKRLYQYENQPNMREKVREYIGELDTEIERVEQCIIENGEDAVDTNNMLFSRIQTIIEVKNDLQGRLEERI